MDSLKEIQKHLMVRKAAKIILNIYNRNNSVLSDQSIILFFK